MNVGELKELLKEVFVDPSYYFYIGGKKMGKKELEEKLTEEQLKNTAFCLGLDVYKIIINKQNNIIKKGEFALRVLFCCFIILLVNYLFAII